MRRPPRFGFEKREKDPEREPDEISWQVKVSRQVTVIPEREDTRKATRIY
jgi:hypothetical protein